MVLKLIRIDYKWNIQHLLFQILEDLPRLESLVRSLIDSARSALSEMYDKYTVSEWLEQKVYPMHSKLLTTRRNGEKLRSVHSWPVRPYQPLPEVERDFSSSTVQTPSTMVQAQGRRVQAPDYYSSRRHRGKWS